MAVGKLECFLRLDPAELGIVGLGPVTEPEVLFAGYTYRIRRAERGLRSHCLGRNGKRAEQKQRDGAIHARELCMSNGSNSISFRQWRQLASKSPEKSDCFKIASDAPLEYFLRPCV